MQIFPPTVAVFQILKEANNEWQHWRIKGLAIHSGGVFSASSLTTSHVAAISRPFSAMVRGAHPKARRSIRRRRWSCGSEKSQVPPASQASPSRHSIPPSYGSAKTMSRIVVRSTRPPLAAQISQTDWPRLSLHLFYVKLPGLSDPVFLERCRGVQPPPDIFPRTQPRWCRKLIRAIPTPDRLHSILLFNISQETRSAS